MPLQEQPLDARDVGYFYTTPHPIETRIRKSLIGRAFWTEAVTASFVLVASSSCEQRETRYTVR